MNIARQSGGDASSSPEKSSATRASQLLIANRQRTKKINVRLLKQIAGALLTELEVTGAELGINLIAAPEMTLVNETFLQHEGSTDVITFDHNEIGRAGNPLPADGAHGVPRPTMHGELFICVDEAVWQAKRFGTSWQLEVVRYVVHGVLHLLGHDDRRVQARRTMKREENRLLRELGRRFSLAQIGCAPKISA